MSHTICQPFIPRALKPEEKREAPRPFLRWVGGKQRLVGSLIDFLPEKIEKYFEPFLGGGSLFFALPIRPRQAILSDLNTRLINAYDGVRNDPDTIHRLVTAHALSLASLGREYYYTQRTLLNSGGHKRGDIEQAARFIFLIHSNFNGVHRENRKGEYNVPFGKINPRVPGLEDLRRASSCLHKSQGVELHDYGYDSIIDRISPGDFVYLDPPYPALNKTAKFTQYTKDAFPFSEQERLAGLARAMEMRGANVMVSISCKDQIAELYPGWKMHETSLRRIVSAKAQRHHAQELIITSYKP